MPERVPLRPCSARVLVALAVVGASIVAPFAGALDSVAAQANAPWTPIEPLAGSLVLAGGGPVPAPVYPCVARLGGGGPARIVVIAGKGKPPQMARWRDLGVRSVTALTLRSKAQLRSEKTLDALLDATAIWLATDVPGLHGSETFTRLLRATLDRGGVVGGNGEGAEVLATALLDGRGKPKRRPEGFQVFPRALVKTDFDRTRDEAKVNDALTAHPGLVGWGIPAGAALVVHQGRKVCVIGRGQVQAYVAAADGWSARTEALGSGTYSQRWDELTYAADLLVWTRSAGLRSGAAFPPKEPAKPSVPKGTLVLCGGKVTDAIWERFIAAAGGKDATIVCIPTAMWRDEMNRSSFSSRELRERGCTKLHVLHTRSRRKADLDAPLRAPLERATGVWIDGGRTFRLMDAYQHTAIHRAIAAVLERGGVVGGSSAGCQVQGDFLMRGSPSSNKPLWQDGYQTGFGLLRGVIIDAHFRQRHREEPFATLMAAFPQMLGIGVDEKTALVVRGSVGEVIGKNAVTFFDSRGDAPRTVQLEAGASYDLAARAQTK